MAARSECRRGKHRAETGQRNARLSPRSERRYRQFRFFVAPTFRLLNLVCVQEREDADRWAALGVARERIHVVGSIKYDSDWREMSEVQEAMHQTRLAWVNSE